MLNDISGAGAHEETATKEHNKLITDVENRTLALTGKPVPLTGKPVPLPQSTTSHIAVLPDPRLRLAGN